MPRKPRQQRSKSTVDAIIQAGLLCVAENGLSGTTTRHIAEKAGVGVGSIYEYFENKEQIFEAMNERMINDITEMIRNLTPVLTSLDREEAIRTLLNETRNWLSKDDNLNLKLLRQATSMDLARRIHPLETALQTLLMNYLMKNPQANATENIAGTSYFFIHGGIFTLVSFLSDPNPPVSFDELLDAMADVIGHYAQW